MTDPAHPAGEVASRLAPFGTTIFTEMTRLAIAHNAVNLSQGFPDFEGPAFIKQAAISALNSSKNQYTRSFGDPALNTAIADFWNEQTGQTADPDTEITVTCGCTEAIAATMLGLVNPGDEVILFEPFYDSYRASVAMAGGVTKVVQLVPSNTAKDHAGRPRFTFDSGQLRAAFSPRTKLSLVNTPHNPTGKVFTRDELACIAELCVRHNIIAVTDEVYELLTFDDTLPHLRLATFPGMAGRTITCSSIGKSFSFTGWKVGWTIAPPNLSRAVRAAHQFLTFATPGPTQLAAAEALRNPLGKQATQELCSHLRSMRDKLTPALESVGFRCFAADGTYFVMADHTEVSRRLGLSGDDVVLCRYLTQHVGVAAIPPSAFYDQPNRGSSYVRFAFCKSAQTIDAAIERLTAKLG